MDDVLQRVRDIAERGSNGATSKESSEALGYELDNIIGEMVHIANTDYNGSYIFAGGGSDTVPYTTIPANGSNITAVNFITNEAETLQETFSQRIEISKGVNIDLSAGQITFHTDNNGDTSINSVFTTLTQLKESLLTGTQEEVGNFIGQIDSLIDNVISERAVVGAKSNRIEQAKSRSESFNTSLNTLISNLGDTDYAEASALYSSQRAVYEASLSVGANIIQPSLLDFLK